MNNDPLSQLHDIEGIADVSWWPLAIGWWILIAVIFAVIIAFIIWHLRKLSFERSWRKDVLEQLEDMQKRLSATTAQEILTSLSELIRRIAIHEHGRQSCAGIEGQAWLSWLKKNDPEHFDWEKKGKPIIEAPYAPEGIKFPTELVKSLINATEKWVK